MAEMSEYIDRLENELETKASASTRAQVGTLQPLSAPC